MQFPNHENEAYDEFGWENQDVEETVAKFTPPNPGGYVVTQIVFTTINPLHDICAVTVVNGVSVLKEGESLDDPRIQLACSQSAIKALLVPNIQHMTTSVVGLSHLEMCFFNTLEQAQEYAQTRAAELKRQYMA